ncbi:MazG-like family protein [Streptomyces sp. NPDC127108]|uniref:MazG-like family protein n=1 Tax=Streptomyces sp. NPDC127108 TaxID=3345361 RepID=UPI0036403EE1
MSDPTPAPPLTAPDLWETVDRLHGWLESHSRHPARETLLLRMLKLSEEVGEVAQAVVGATGQNPRKGTTHTWDDVESELCDVVITALVALRTLTPAPERALDARLRAVAARSTSPSPPSPQSPGAAPVPAPAPAPAESVRPEVQEIQERPGT